MLQANIPKLLIHNKIMYVIYKNSNYCFVNCLLFLQNIKVTMRKFHKLTIQEIKRETKDAVSILFSIPQAIKNTFLFKAGQYVTLKKVIQGEEVRRAYSICSGSQEGELRVAIKAVENGKFSTYATTELRVGDTIEVMPPEGKFVLEPQANKQYIGFAAGSGITPILAMIKDVIGNAEAKFTLVYGNKTASDTIFFQELNALQKTHSERLTIQYVYSREENPNAFSGRIDATRVAYVFQELYKDTTFDAAFLCGPEEMITTASEVIEGTYIAKENIHFELFTASTVAEDTSQIAEGITQVKVLLDDEEVSFSMPHTDTILAASLRNKLDAPYSCQGGVCSSCIAKVTEGKAVMTKKSILSEEELEEGFVLTCIAHPTTPVLEVDYDDV